MRGANPGRCAEPWIKPYKECGKASRTAPASALLVARAYLFLKTPLTHSSSHLCIININTKCCGRKLQGFKSGVKPRLRFNNMIDPHGSRYHDSQRGPREFGGLYTSAQSLYINIFVGHCVHTCRSNTCSGASHFANTIACCL